MTGLSNVIDKFKKHCTSMGAIISTRYNDQKQIISKKSLDCVQILIKYLKRNAEYAGIFQVGGRRLWITKIYRLILNGNTFRLEKILEDEGDNIVLECACALKMFLMNLRTPLIPEHIQALVLGDNNDVGSEIVARDVLGLIRQDMKGRQLSLLTQILDLLHYVCKHSTTNELTGSYMPVQMLPIFFQLTYDNMVLWRRIASIFEEIIREAPTILESIPSYESISEMDQQPSGQIFRLNEQHPVVTASDTFMNRRDRSELMFGEHFNNNNNNYNNNQQRRIEINFIYSQFIFYTGDRFPYSPRTTCGQLHPIIRRNRDRLSRRMNQISSPLNRQAHQISPLISSNYTL